MKWITRERPKIDRIACPWLISRFIDKSPEFIFVPANQVIEKAQALLLAISLGLSHNFQDDQEMLQHGFVMYDALYAWCKSVHDEKHTWNPQVYA